jgi:DNA-binding LacI/PurR family transcriptional regulator
LISSERSSTAWALSSAKKKSMQGLAVDNVARPAARLRPAALMCYDDEMALHFLDALRRETPVVPVTLAIRGSSRRSQRGGEEIKASAEAGSLP